ncbi:orotate phosphoribosyltransferase [Candidatus Bathyarchaeota archaeon]|nr:MAG: orotate phosphoribosyltransferase [Candidatus Bathyarchaeota archaeon]
MQKKKSRETIKAEICNILNKIGALKFGAFKLTSGKISPYYIDLRIIPSVPDAFREICNLQSDFISQEIGLDNFDRIAGIPIAGIPFASLVAYNVKKPFLYIRKGVRFHGRQRRIEGILTPGDRVLLIDDLITTGLSLVEAAKAIEAEGGVAANAVVLLDRQEEGRKNLEKNGIKLHALLRISEIADRLYEIGAIDEVQLNIILKQIKK